jgi:uncharacterized protein YjbJ (UPF0337 family)
MGTKSDQIKGHAKEAAGILTGEKDVEAEGKTDRLTGGTEKKIATRRTRSTTCLTRPTTRSTRPSTTPRTPCRKGRATGGSIESGRAPGVFVRGLVVHGFVLDHPRSGETASRDVTVRRCSSVPRSAHYDRARSRHRRLGLVHSAEAMSPSRFDGARAAKEAPDNDR